MVRAAWLWCRKLPEGCESEAELRHPTTGKLSVNTAINGYFLSQVRIRQKEDMDGLRLSFAVPKIRWDSSPFSRCPYGIPTPLRLLGYGRPLPMCERDQSCIKIPACMRHHLSTLISGICSHSLSTRDKNS